MKKIMVFKMVINLNGIKFAFLKNFGDYNAEK